MADLLIIDDDPDLVDALAELMLAEGHDVRVAHDGAEGLRLAHARLPDLVIVDVEMPILGGPGMALQMLVQDMGLETVPIVLLSGVVNLPEIAKQVGTPYYLGKPYRYEHVVALINRALRERVAPRAPDRDSSGVASRLT